MNEDPPVTLSRAFRHGPWRKQFRGLAVALVLGCALGIAGGYGYARLNGLGASQNASLSEDGQDAAMRRYNAENRYLRMQLDIADGELAIERAARLELEAELNTAQAEVGRVRDQLAFYERLLPPGPEGSVEIRGAEVDRQSAGLRYKILLMRSGKGEAFAGTLRFESTGVINGETVTVTLEPLQIKNEGAGTQGADVSAGRLAVHFEQYQRSQGMLGLPDGFVPDSVTVSLMEGDTVRASRTLKLEF